MNLNERSSHPSRAQIELLLEFFDKNPSLAKGFSKIPSARESAKKQWERVTFRLNSIGGSVKSWKQWNKYWADKKSAVRKKALVYAAGLRKSEGGSEAVVELSDVEERILSIIGFNPAAVNPLQTSQSITLTQETESTDNEDIKMPEMPVFDSAEGVNPQTETSPRGASPPPTPPPPSSHATSRESSPADSARGKSPPRSIRGRGRRRVGAGAGAVSFTERLVRVEEQRLALDRRNTAILEATLRLVEQLLQRDRRRDRVLAHSLANIGEGVKVLAEALGR